MSILQRFPINIAGRDFAVGDIHGHFTRLQRALDAVSFDPAADRLFSVGDTSGREEGMSEETEVLTVEGLAKLLGRTEASIREGIRRGVPWLPKSFKMGNRHCWLKEDVRKFLREFRDGEHQKPKPGRKRKEPPSLREVA